MQKIYKSIILGISLIFCISNAYAKLFDASEFYLDNGLRVIVVPNHKAPIIKHMVWYLSGAVDEPMGKGGVAHLLEHLMFRGTSNVPEQNFNKIMEENGADSNAFTSLEKTAYHQELDISKLELAMALEADRMQNLDVSEEAFVLERDIVFQERMQVVENNPISPFSEAYRKLVWGEHPYGRPVSGTSEEIKNLQLSDVQNYYNHFYAPNNAILVLSGDIDVAMAKKLANKYYGKIPAKKLGNKANFPKLKQDVKSELKMMLPHITTGRIVKTYLAPSFKDNKDEIYNLSVLSRYLGEGDTSELYKSLVEKQKLALSISSAFDYTNRSYSIFSITALPAAGVTTEELNEAIEQSLKEAIQNISLDKIENTKHKMLSGLVYLKDNPFTAAEIIGSMASAGMSLSEIETHAEMISRVKYKNVKEAAQKIFNNNASFSGIVLPLSGEK